MKKKAAVETCGFGGCPVPEVGGAIVAGNIQARCDAHLREVEEEINEAVGEASGVLRRYRYYAVSGRGGKIAEQIVVRVNTGASAVSTYRWTGRTFGSMLDAKRQLSALNTNEFCRSFPEWEWTARNQNASR